MVKRAIIDAGAGDIAEGAGDTEVVVVVTGEAAAVADVSLEHCCAAHTRDQCVMPRHVPQLAIWTLRVRS